MVRSRHFLEMLNERNIDEKWVNITENHDDGTQHFIKQIQECDNKWLRVIVNIIVDPNREVTVFFDRRLRKIHESKG
ncbi:MAG: DUF4258 domain-containing protein [Spirochaetes bacterium]|nr:MAG: DUF4258 domain-containing protein [Spirochaetota bacterium]